MRTLIQANVPIDLAKRFNDLCKQYKQKEEPAWKLIRDLIDAYDEKHNGELK